MKKCESDDDTSNGSHFDISSSQMGENVKETKPMLHATEENGKRIHKTVSKNKVSSGVHHCLVEGCGKSFRKLIYLEGHQLKHAGVDVSKAIFLFRY
jgi:hypothetical protein